jgi:hypothetical protein
LRLVASCSALGSPQLDPAALTKASLLVPAADTWDAATGLPAESYPQGYFTRCKKFAPLLAEVTKQTLRKS